MYSLIKPYADKVASKSLSKSVSNAGQLTFCEISDTFRLKVHLIVLHNVFSQNKLASSLLTNR